MQSPPRSPEPESPRKRGIKLSIANIRRQYETPGPVNFLDDNNKNKDKDNSNSNSNTNSNSNDGDETVKFGALPDSPRKAQIRKRMELRIQQGQRGPLMPPSMASLAESSPPVETDNSTNRSRGAGTAPSLRASMKRGKRTVISSVGAFHGPWEFGKFPKSFVPPENNRQTNKAAVTIQRMIRGWWQRLKFKLRLYQWKIKHRDQITKDALDAVARRVQIRKDKYRTKLMAQKEKNQQEVSEEAVAQAKELIRHLREENTKIRQRNQKLREAVKTIKQQNERLESANSMTDGNYSTLNDHMQQIKETNEKLNAVVPMYKNKVDELEREVYRRDQYCEMEHNTKHLYGRVINDIVLILENRCKQKKLIEEVTGYMLDSADLENPYENELNIKKKETKTTAKINDKSNNKGRAAQNGDDDDDDSSSSSDDSSLDDYTVATFD